MEKFAEDNLPKTEELVGGLLRKNNPDFADMTEFKITDVRFDGAMLRDNQVLLSPHCRSKLYFIFNAKFEDKEKPEIKGDSTVIPVLEFKGAERGYILTPPVADEKFTEIITDTLARLEQKPAGI